MSKGLKVTGGVLLGAGILIGIVGIVLAVVGLSMDEEEIIADNSDFDVNNDGDYTYEIYVSSDFYIRITSASNSQVMFDLKVEDLYGTQKLDLHQAVTPIDKSVGITLYDYGTWEITIHFTEENTTLNQVDVEIYQLSPTAAGSMMCCMGMFAPFVGLVMIIVGIVLLIVGFTRKKKEPLQPPVFNQPQQGSYGGYPPQTGSYGGYPPQTGTYGGYPPQTPLQTGSYGGSPPQGGSYGGQPPQTGYGKTTPSIPPPQRTPNLPPQQQQTSPPPSYGGPKVAPPPPSSAVRSGRVYDSPNEGYIRTNYNSSPVYDMKVDDKPRTNLRGPGVYSRADDIIQRSNL